MIGPADRPPTRPSATNAEITASVRVAANSAIANSAKPISMISMCLPVLSARTPPMGTDALTIHKTKLVAEPAAARLQPRSTSMAVPKPKTMLSAALNRPQMHPATTTAWIARGWGQVAGGAVVPDPVCGGTPYSVASRRNPSAQNAVDTKKATATPLVAAMAGNMNRHNAIPAGQELTKIAMAVAISLPANQSVTIFDINTLS